MRRSKSNAQQCLYERPTRLLFGEARFGGALVQVLTAANAVVNAQRGLLTASAYIQNILSYCQITSCFPKGPGAQSLRHRHLGPIWLHHLAV